LLSNATLTTRGESLDSQTKCAGTRRASAFATRLQAKKGKDIWIMGGAGIIASFLDEGEINEFMIHVVPKFIGKAIPLIAPGRRTVPLRLIFSTKFTDGVVKLHYAVRK
jgi:dihydrofolate reductase